jgi:hypothetical protein
MVNGCGCVALLVLLPSFASVCRLMHGSYHQPCDQCFNYPSGNWGVLRPLAATLPLARCQFDSSKVEPQSAWMCARNVAEPGDGPGDGASG